VNENLTLALYSGAILTGSLAGGALPFLGKRARSDSLLSFSAGVMLGAAFFHMLPEAVHLGGPDVVPWTVAGFLFLFLLERFVLVHVCAEPGPSERLRGHPAPPPHGLREHAGHDHAHEATGCDVHTLGLAAFIGLSLHTLVDGFALGAAQSDPALGVLVFVAILAHKIPSSVSLTAILRAEGYSKRQSLLMNASFALMVPAGAAIFLLLDRAIHANRFTAIALAASAGSFLQLSLSDILPDLHRRGGSRWKISIALLGGLAAMWLLRSFGHSHG
jgi:zinc and cadmium transporter